jgi:hypothetical protein
MTLVNRLIPVHVRMQNLADRLGIPQYETVVRVYQNIQYVMEPRPKLLSMTKHDVNEFLANSVETNLNHIWLTEVPRTMSLTELNNCRYILNAQLSAQNVWYGVMATPIFVLRNELLTWRVLLKKENAR